MKPALVALGILLAAAAPAAAQSKKYPPVDPDRELADERRSDTWDSALHPDTKPYQDLIRDAKRIIDQSSSTPDDLKAALEKLDNAVKRMPKAAEAYLLRGQLFLTQKDWGHCADDLGRAEDYTKSDDLTVRTKTRIDLGNCQARAGRLADAETTYVRAAASAQSQKAELWMRLGEVRIALGKLDEAIDALSASLDADPSNATTRWLLMAAYDRARRPSEALDNALMARRFDGSRTYIDRPPIPFLGPAEADYLSGLAYRYAMPPPEYALVYFRRYVKTAGDSPWKRRAEEHVRELSAMKWPSRETINSSGTAAVQIEDVRKALDKPVATMRQCLAKLPLTVFQITVMKSGPRTPETVRDRPIYRLPPAPKPVTQQLTLDGASKDVLDEASRCLEMQVSKISLTPPKERDTYYTLSFAVVGP